MIYSKTNVKGMKVMSKIVKDLAPVFYDLNEFIDNWGDEIHKVKSSIVDFEDDVLSKISADDFLNIETRLNIFSYKMNISHIENHLSDIKNILKSIKDTVFPNIEWMRYSHRNELPDSDADNMRIWLSKVSICPQTGPIDLIEIEFDFEKSIPCKIRMYKKYGVEIVTDYINGGLVEAPLIRLFCKDTCLDKLCDEVNNMTETMIKNYPEETDGK